VLSAAPWALSAALGAAWLAGRRKRPPPPRFLQPKPQPGLSEQKIADPTHFEAQEPGRGRTAAAPRHIPWRGWRDIAWRTWREMSQDRLTVVAGSVTYYTLLAIFPALGVFVSLYGLIADVKSVEAQLAQLSAIIPPEAVRLLGEQMMRLATGRAEGLSVAFVVSLLFSLWSANAGMKSLFDGLNIAYDETEKRNYFYRSAVTYGFTAALIVFLTLVSAILVAAPLALEAVGLRTDILIAARWPLVYVVAAGAFTIAYRYGPSRTLAHWRWLIPGGVLAALLWMAGSAGFSWYLNNVAKLNATYGSLGAVIGFMLWVWFSVMVVLLGAEFNAEIEHQTALDSTVGPEKPMGERGAAMADTVGLRFVGFRKGVGLLWSGARGSLDRILRRKPATFSPARPPEPPAAPPDPRRSADR
jgi:membrane protein